MAIRTTAFCALVFAMSAIATIAHAQPYPYKPIRIIVSITGLLTTMPHVKAGRVKLLGVGHTQRLRWMPDLPTIAETIAGYYNTGWWGLVAPAGLPKPIVDRLNPIMNKWLITPPIFAPIK